MNAPQQIRMPSQLLRVVVLVAAMSALSISISMLKSSADVRVASDDFEGSRNGPTGYGWIAEWDTVAAAITGSRRPYSGSAHLQLQGEGSSAVRSAEVTGESLLSLRFWARADRLDDNEGVVEVSANGSDFVEVARFAEGGVADGSYTFFDIDLGSVGVAFSDLFVLRIRLFGPDSDEGDLFIDDIHLDNRADNPIAPPVTSDSQIVIDGDFSDWPGKASLADALDDHAGSDRNDLAAFYWANNIDEEINFHMLERHTRDGEPFDGRNGHASWARYMVYIDANNNGNFTETSDRRAVVTYVPSMNTSFVNVKVFPANSSQKISDSGWNDWGDSRTEGGLRVEFPLDWSDLGIQFGGVIRIYAVSFSGTSSSPGIMDRVPDGNADIQWSPASVLGPWLLGAAGVLGITVIWFLSRRRQLWR